MLTEEVGFSFFFEVGFKNAGSRSTNALGVGHRQAACISGRILFNCEQGRNSLPVLVLPAHGVAWPLGSDHHHIDISRGLDQFEADVETVGKAQNLPTLEVGSDFFLVNVLLEFIGKQHHDPVRLGGGLGHG